MIGELENELAGVVVRLRAERDAMAAENARLRAALEAAGASMMYFDVGKRTEAYLEIRKALGHCE